MIIEQCAIEKLVPYANNPRKNDHAVAQVAAAIHEFGFRNYVPRIKGNRMKMHSNRTVIHPDYAGLGLGIRLINETSRYMHLLEFDVWAKFSSAPIAKEFSRNHDWKLISVARFANKITGNMKRKTGFRDAVKTYSYHYEPRLT